MGARGCLREPRVSCCQLALRCNPFGEVQPGPFFLGARGTAMPSLPGLPYPNSPKSISNKKETQKGRGRGKKRLGPRLWLRAGTSSLPWFLLHPERARSTHPRTHTPNPILIQPIQFYARPFPGLRRVPRWRSSHVARFQSPQLSLSGARCPTSRSHQRAAVGLPTIFISIRRVLCGAGAGIATMAEIDILLRRHGCHVVSSRLVSSLLSPTPLAFFYTS